MQLSLLQENFNNALQTVSRFVSLKTQLPILGHVLIASDQGRIRFSATNLEMGISYWVGGQIKKEGSFTVPAKEIAEFVSYLSVGKIDLNLNDNGLLELVSPKAQSTFTTTASTDFPSIALPSVTTAIELDYSLFSQTISQVAFAAATDDSRPILTAVLCRFTPNSFSLVATDGFRLSLKEIKLIDILTLPPEQSELTFLVPARSLFEVSKIAKTASKLSLSLSQDSRQLVFAIPDIHLTSRLIDGDFPDYHRIIPEAFTTKVTLDRSEFAQAIKIASVFARESANVVKLSVKKSSLEVSANATQIGTNKASVDARIEGEPLEIAFNYKFISDFLSICQGSEVTISLNEPLTPGLFQDSSNLSLTHIIMPVRIQD